MCISTVYTFLNLSTVILDKLDLKIILQTNYKLVTVT